MPNQFGSFGAGVSPEGMRAIREAMERRQMGGNIPALNQQSTASPTAAPVPANIPTTGGGQIESFTEPGNAPAAMPGDSESLLILKALKERLGTISQLDKAKSGL